VPPPPPPVVVLPFPDEVDDDSVPDAEDTDGLLSRPPHSTEVFVSGLARTTSEEELRAVAEPHGALFEVRLLSDPATGQNRGYGFLVYTRREDAAAATEALNGVELKGRKLRASLSPVKHRLFIGGLPKERFTGENLQRVLRKAVVGVDVVDVPPPDRVGSTGTSRGFAFVSFYNTACAEKARRLLGSPEFKLRDRPLTVNWAEKTGEDSAAAATVKSIYVNNLPPDCKPESLKAVFEQFGDVERVMVPQMRAHQQPGGGPSPAGPDGGAAPQRARYGFVHFVERSAALAAVDAAESGAQKFELEGNTLEVSLAKPDKGPQGGQGPGGMMHVMPPTVGAAVAAVTQGRGGMGAGGIAMRGGMYARGGGGGMPMMAPMMQPGMALAPMVMPNGQVAYVMQPPQGPGGGPPFHGGGGGGGYQQPGYGPPHGGPRGPPGGRGGRGGGYAQDARYRPY
jgi:heterogeneous nuclear ribonucleoprotein R